ncbi:uncharacterized protein EV420DRAFT_594659 [Desarmillaria tabescens]|uniref:HMG box domain-containing protein n=1 Tax=Armillaria tabescens TaxID=1929756 RepID=A0AA39N223_ARMTA|nr:uncharacterized protein EV420DRAFT_594659 [Desarmillaria tabescens]KAK0455326.1 hypothetical protein EV420DRAFT_594659 [Desarmillaria tabescens]
MAPIRSTTSIRSERLSQEVVVAGDAVGRGLLVSSIVDAILQSGFTLRERSRLKASRRKHKVSRLSTPAHIPRPPNPFFLFRSECTQELNTRFPDKAYTSNDFSTHVGRHWKSLTEKQKEVYGELAREAEKKHQELYPGYKYHPESGKRKQKRGKGKKDAEEGTVTVALEANFVPYIPPTPVTREPEFTVAPIAIPVLVWPIQGVEARLDSAPPPSHLIPPVAQYDFADGTALPPHYLLSGPQASFKASVDPSNILWGPPTDISVADSFLSFGTEEFTSDFGNLDDIAPLPEINDDDDASGWVDDIVNFNMFMH